MINILYPKKCVACGELLNRYDGIFCAKCAKTVTYVKTKTCMKCGKLINDEKEEFCKDCKNNRLRFLDYNRGVFLYEGAVKEALYKLKYSKKSYIGKRMAHELFENTAKWVHKMQINAVVPVPVSKERLRKRGYNQAEVIARNYVKDYNRIMGKEELKIVPIVKRIKNTLPQKALRADIRRKNLKKAFKLDQSVVELTRLNNYAVNCKKILIVDDIYTTGATLDAMAELLKQRGISNFVCGITVAVGKDL